MKITKFILPLIFGLMGGLIAFFVAGEWKADSRASFAKHELIGPGMPRPVVHQVLDEGESGGAGSVDLRMAAKKTVPAVVNVKTVQMGKEYYGSPLDFWFGIQPQVREVPRNMGIGSGVIITEDGYIITNNHVIDGSDHLIVTLNDKREFEAKVIGSDPNTDIALIKIDAEGLQPIEYGNSDDVVLGEWVLAVGNPYNLTSTVTAGIISAKARELGGKMNLKEYGKVQRAVIGIRMGEQTPSVAKELDVDAQYGIYVGEVIKGGAAAKAGLKEGDVIQQLNGYEVKTVPEFQEQLAKYAPGDAIQFVVNRAGKKKVVDLVLQSSFGDIAISESDGVLGAKVETLTQQERYRYRLSKGVKIKELRDGKFKSAGLTEGYIILKINDTVVHHPEDLERAIKAVGDGGIFVTAVNPRGRVEYFAFSLQD